MPYMTNGKRDYKKEYAALLLKRKNNEEYDAKYKKDAAARACKSWHKNKTPEKLAAKRLYTKEYREKYPEKVKLTSQKTYQKNKEKRIAYSRKYNKKNKEKIAKQTKAYCLQHKEYLRAWAKEYRKNNKKLIKKRHKEWYEKNKKKVYLYHKSYRKNNEEKVKLWQKKYYEKYGREYTRNYNREKCRQDYNFRLKNRIRTRIWDALSGRIKKFSTKVLLDVPNLEFLWQHLEKQFQPGMTRENYGLWHVDHIIPCASFDFSDPEQQKKCFHYTNLQPLWAIDNMRKSNKIMGEELKAWI